MRGLEVFLLGFISFQHVSTYSSIKFFKNAFPGPHAVSQTLLDQSPPRPNHSASQCGVVCRTAPPDGESRVCIGFLYSLTTGLCQVSYQVSSLQALYSQGYGDAYMGCDLTRGYGVYKLTSGAVVCLLLVQFPQVYTTALAVCNQNQGYLVSTKTQEKIELVRSFLEGTEEELWIGASDSVQEGTFLWEEDGTALTSTHYENLFMRGEPNNGGPGGTEDCLVVAYRAFGLNDVSCGVYQLAFVCEMKLVADPVAMVVESSNSVGDIQVHSASSSSSFQTGGGLVAQTSDGLVAIG